MIINCPENKPCHWQSLPSQKTLGTKGFTTSKAVEFSDFKIRELCFSDNYEADHWCEKGHIIHVVEGELIIEFDNGSQDAVKAGNSYVIGDNGSSHKVKTTKETKVIIID